MAVSLCIIATNESVSRVVSSFRRVAQLERRLRGEVDELPSSVMDLKRQVDHFREKLETTEHLSWLGENFSRTL
jgi:predicted nuclease with TOPRIM domain